MTAMDSTVKNRWPKDTIWLILETVCIVLAGIPIILWALIKKFLPCTSRKQLKGEVVLITGAGNGLGRELALRMAEKGCKLALVDINEEAVRNVASVINQKREQTVKYYVANVGKPQDITILGKNIISDFGRVDMLINNAGLVHLGRSFLNLVDEEIDALFQINVISQFGIIRQFLPGMLERNHGHIVAISSVSSYVGVGNASAYASTKWALTGMMASLQEELRMIDNNRVKLSVVCPYFIDTNPLFPEILDLRMPSIPVREAADAVIDGVEREEFEFSIPSHMSVSVNLFKIFPESLKNLITSVYYFRIRTVPEKTMEHLPTTKIIGTLNQKG